jgi:hypothetical protein
MKTPGLRALPFTVSRRRSFRRARRGISADVAAGAHTGRSPHTLRPVCLPPGSETTRSSAQPTRITDAASSAMGRAGAKALSFLGRLTARLKSRPSTNLALRAVAETSRILSGQWVRTIGKLTLRSSDSRSSDRRRRLYFALISARFWRIVSTRLIMNCRRSRPGLVRVMTFSMVENMFGSFIFSRSSFRNG